MTRSAVHPLELSKRKKSKITPQKPQAARSAKRLQIQQQEIFLMGPTVNTNDKWWYPSIEWCALHLFDLANPGSNIFKLSEYTVLRHLNNVSSNLEWKMVSSIFLHRERFFHDHSSLLRFEITRSRMHQLGSISMLVRHVFEICPSLHKRHVWTILHAFRQKWASTNANQHTWVVGFELCPRAQRDYF